MIKRKKAISGRVCIEVKGIKVFDQGYASVGKKNWAMRRILSKLESKNYTITFSPNITEEVENFHCSRLEKAEEVFNNRPQW